MAPVSSLLASTGRPFRHPHRSAPSLPLRSLITSSLTSVLVWSGRQAVSIAARAAEVISHTSIHSSRAPISSPSPPSSFDKRQVAQNQIVAIPTTYKGLNAGPPPATVVGIVVGSVGGFLLILALFYSILRFSGIYSTTVVEEKVIRRRTRSASHSRQRRSPSRSESTEVRSEVRSPPRRQPSRREETIIVEERVSRGPEPPPEDDIVEVIEDHSPERRPRRESKRMSGFRTVDPAEFGGGDRPMRKVSRRG